MKTLKNIVNFFVFILLAIGGLIFAASFAVDTLQSWPKALMEARVVLYGQILLGLTLGWTTGKWCRWLNMATIGAAFAALFTFTWYLGTVPEPRFAVCLSGMITFILMGGVVAGELMRECFKKSRATSPRPLAPSQPRGDYWKN